MTRLQVKFILLTFFVLLGVGGLSSAHSFQTDLQLSLAEPTYEGSFHLNAESSDGESIDLPSPSHGDEKNLCLPLEEPAEEQELGYKSLKKKLDRCSASPTFWTLSLRSVPFYGNKLSPPEWTVIFTSTCPRYLTFCNLRS